MCILISYINNTWFLNLLSDNSNKNECVSSVVDAMMKHYLKLK